MTTSMKTYVVEHLDPELEEWSSLEYASIAAETHAAGSTFLLTSVKPETLLPPNLKAINGFKIEHRSVEELFEDKKAEVCLLDPSAAKELSPADASHFNVFLFGGILGMRLIITWKSWDMLNMIDLGDDPPRGKLWVPYIWPPFNIYQDRTSELRKKGYEGRRLGPVQMTTDTAVRVTRIVIQDQIPVDKIKYVDNPELKLNQHESTQMPFRYVKGDDGQPIMPDVRLPFSHFSNCWQAIGNARSHTKGWWKRLWWSVVRR
jgi:ribosome biogenesis SPOUT family RNA methylase Rps3